jgi:uncharacterized membrane protein
MKNKIRFYIGHSLVITSIFLMGFFFPIQLLLPIPIYVWVIPIILLFLGIYQNVIYSEKRKENNSNEIE